jgi:acetyltransferase-like isoleucine patch superfamily enzyme
VNNYVTLGEGVTIGEYCVLGARPQRLNVDFDIDDNEFDSPCRILDDVYIGHHVTIYRSSLINSKAYLDDYSRVGHGSTIGARTMLLYGARVYDRVRIGDDCRIAGFVPDRVVMGNRVTMMGQIAHKYDRPLNWDREEPSAAIEDDVIVGMGATLVGGITIGSGSYIAAGAVCTKDVPPNSFVCRFNDIRPLSEGPKGARG